MILKLSFLLLLSAGIQAQVHLKANDPLIRYDLIRTAHYYNRGASFDSTGHISFEFLAEHVVKADSIRKEYLFVRYSPFGVGVRMRCSSVPCASRAIASIFVPPTSTPIRIVILPLLISCVPALRSGYVRQP